MYCVYTWKCIHMLTHNLAGIHRPQQLPNLQALHTIFTGEWQTPWHLSARAPMRLPWTLRSSGIHECQYLRLKEPNTTNTANITTAITGIIGIIGNLIVIKAEIIDMTIGLATKFGTNHTGMNEKCRRHMLQKAVILLDKTDTTILTWIDMDNHIVIRRPHIPLHTAPKFCKRLFI